MSSNTSRERAYSKSPFLMCTSTAFQMCTNVSTALSRSPEWTASITVSNANVRSSPVRTGGRVRPWLAESVLIRSLSARRSCGH